MRVLTVTNMWPSPEAPQFGVFVARQAEELHATGVEVDVLFVNGRRSRLEYARGVPRFRKRLRGAGYDLVHAYYVFSGVIARAQRGTPVVLTLTGVEALRGWQARLSWAVARTVDAVVVRSEEMRGRLALPDAPIVPAGVDLDLFRPLPREEARRRLGLEQGGGIVLFIGEPRPEKRLDLLRAAVELLRADGAQVRLRLVSGRPQDEVALHLNAADALVLASEGEGSPGAVKEAMACNVPVVAVDVGDVAQVIRGTEGCHIVERTPEDFARALGDVLARGERTRGRDAVASLSWPAVTERLLQVYRGVLDGR